jgi:arylsulfatase A-like enzyme
MRFYRTTLCLLQSLLLFPCLFSIGMTGCSPSHEAVQQTADTIVPETTIVPENIVLISIDTLRADHLGSYGFPDGYTATIDRIAARGKIRHVTYTTIPHTTPGHASLMTGLYPAAHGSRFNAIPIRQDVQTLAQVFHHHGYSTAGSVGHFLLSPESSGLDAGFEYYRAPSEPRMEPGVTGEGIKVYPVGLNTFRPWKTVNKYAQSWLSTVSEPWFLFLHYYECHAPYEPRFPWNSIPGLHRYDGEIAGVDRAVSDVMNMLFLTGWKNNVDIIITSDHGESIGEHGAFGHGFNLYFPSMLIPWISIGIPGDTGIQNGLFSIMDIAPTILANRNIPYPAALDGVPDTASHDRVYGECPPFRRDEPHHRIFSVRNEDFALIYHQHENNTELYNLNTDPGETGNVADRHPQQTGMLTQSVETYITTDTADFVNPDDVLRPEVKDALEALGYITRSDDRERPESRE